jgi:hypothetical protein
MSKKLHLSPSQAEWLILLRDVTDTAPDGRWQYLYSGTPYWSDTLKRHVWCWGNASVSPLRALARKGLIKLDSEYGFFVKITEAGALVVEGWRASNEWPVEVRR